VRVTPRRPREIGANVSWSDELGWSEEETDNPLLADDRNFYKLEKWTKDGTEVDRLLYAGNNLEKAHKIFVEAIKHRPRIMLTIRQRKRVLEPWPELPQRPREHS
jgi:hypothetical protein